MDYLPFKDISYAQGAWDMDTDSDPIVAMKASGGDGSSGCYLDSQLVRNYADATRLGKVPIMYHFAGGNDATTEANYFIAAISPYAVGDVYALDWEVENNDPVGWCETFMNVVHAATSVWPLIYMDIDRLNDYNWTPVLENCGLWLAAPSYGFDETIPEVNNVYVAQQGPVANGVDTDAWFGTKEQLLAYGYQTQTSTPAPTPEPTPSPTPTPTPEPDPSPVQPEPTSPEPTTPTTPSDPTPTPTDPTTPPVVTPPVPPVVSPPAAAPTNKGVVAAILAAILAVIAIVLGFIHH